METAEYSTAVSAFEIVRLYVIYSFSFVVRKYFLPVRKVSLTMAAVARYACGFMLSVCVKTIVLKDRIN
jgi:hypothetical protein